jgi:hypothetical protein
LSLRALEAEEVLLAVVVALEAIAQQHRLQ